MSESPKSPDEPVHPEDIFAGKLLGGLLSLFFLYTVFSTIGVVWWTWRSING